MKTARILGLLLLASCGRTAAPSQGTSEAAAPRPHVAPRTGTDAGVIARALRDASTPIEVTAATTANPWPKALATPAMGPPGAITIVGFPNDLRTCLPDPAHHAGFTKDGAELGYCATGMALRCEMVDRSGRLRKVDTFVEREGPSEDPAQVRILEKWMKDVELPKLASGQCTFRPPALTGTWAYPDITIHVVTAPPTFKKTPAGDEVVSQPFVRIGGALPGQKPVFPITLSAPHDKLIPPAVGEIPYNVAELNAFALSPDNEDLGIVVHSFCMEWCDRFEIRRLAASSFASLVYNDAGFRLYEKGDLPAAADLFARAAFVDRSRELPAYNLACTYARLGDPKAKDALEIAIQRGGQPVKDRAKKDKDFTSVRAAAWFEGLVGK